MDIEEEKKAIINKLQNIDDPSVIKEIKLFLENEEKNDRWEHDNEFKASITKGLDDIKNGHITPHKEVMKKLRNKYTS